MAETIEYYKKQNELLQRKIEMYEKDATFRGFYALNKVVNEQVDILNEIKLKDEITKSPKDDKYFDRAKSLWEGLKSMITDLAALKSELKITGSQEKDEKNIPFIETVATRRD